MKTTIKNFLITSTYTGSKKAAWCNNTNNRNHYKIRVYNRMNKKAITFDFWVSIAEPEIKDEKSLLCAFCCFLEDSVLGGYDFDEFIDEFGYSEAKEAYRIWLACKDSMEKLRTLRVSDRQTHDMIMGIREIENA